MENRVVVDLTLGNYLKDKRLSSGKTLLEMGELLGVSSTIIGLVENGKRMPSIDLLHLFSQNLMVDMATLLDKRIETVIKTVDIHGEKTPSHIKNEYYLINYLGGG